MNIDWNRSADGNATHYDPVDNNFLLQVIGSSLVWSNGEGWANHLGQYPDNLSELARIVPRQAEPEVWSGTGLPPVGTVCEFFDESMDEADWHAELRSGMHVEVIAHFKGATQDVAAFVFSHGPGGVNRQVEQAVAECFRPIRTPEQIAAEERDQAARGMYSVAWPEEPWDETSPDWKDAFRRLHDAGYGKKAQP